MSLIIRGIWLPVTVRHLWLSCGHQQGRTWITNSRFRTISCQQFPKHHKLASVQINIFSVCPPPDDCLSEWVIVIDDKNPYPGRVLEVHEGELFVDCLHAVGKPFSNTSFWPCLYRDLCWYEYDKLVTVIPKAVLKTGSAKHFAVDAQIWEAAMKKSLSQTDFSQVLQSLWNWLMRERERGVHKEFISMVVWF